MARTYSIYEAKARFSEVIREVREGETVTVSYRGKPVAEIHAIQQSDTPTLADRIDLLERRGALVRSTRPRRDFKKVADRPGALARFLAERGE
ncbi:MAG: type II toxin-antitoxin system prevent-host-death family antitoxin [Gammaproteobacteria bacterium]|nr:type II toxin-antitoxin system prevent-host-death family antitoxin [Gammaproteobacteria bacterium]MXW45000.1 type II toxin-antitoxin system prevent-host-death family antitoxin [Gammaproteobacteria bacterium]MYD01694.1 type II toxin-antitoxin system prevent-host-death family antitoxin [Gammaproteobacteria bacterium]MYI25402.1 type II toxin-antitoxin system prevent-host-death family antitoxin [Gammaproteobacteria bacterium]